MDEITAIVVNILKQKLELPADLPSIDENTRMDIFDINSMTFIEFVVGFEDGFDIKFDNEHLGYNMFETVGDLSAFIMQKLKEKSQP